MPRLPTYTAEVGQYGTSSGRRASTADFFDTSIRTAVAGKGAQFAASAVNHAASLMGQSPKGRGLQQLGNAVRQVTDDYVRIQEQRDVADQQVETAKARARLSEKLFELEQEGETGLAEKMDEILQEEAENLRNNASTRAGMEAAERGVQSLNLSIGSRARSAEAKILGDKAQQDTTEILTALGYDLGQSPDRLAEAVDDFTIFARNTGLPEQQERELVREGRSKLAVIAAHQQIQDNATVGKQMVEKGLYDPYIDIGTKQGLLDLADRKIESNRRTEISNVRGLIEDDQASIRVTGQGVPGLESRVAAIGDEEVLRKFREGRERARAGFEFRTKAQFAKPEKLVEMLEAKRPEPGTEGFADKQEMFESLRKTASQMVADRVDDPFAYAAQDGSVNKLGEQAAENPALYEKVVTANLETQKAMGIAESARRVTSNAQADQMIGEINSAPVTERASKLREMLQPYGRHKRKAMAELQQAGLDPQVFGLLNVHDEPMLASAMAEAQAVGREELTTGMPSEFDEKTLKMNVRDELADLQAAVESVPGRVGAYNQTILEPLVDTALVFERRGLDWTDATDRFLNQFEIYDTFYIPRKIEGQPVNVAGVEAATEFLQTEEKIREFRPAVFGGIPEGLNVEDSYEAVVSAAVNNGFWATNATGDGLQLMLKLNDGSSIPLVNDEGDRYTIDMMNPPSSPENWSPRASDSPLSGTSR